MPNTDASWFGPIAREHRRALNWPQRRLANKLGLSITRVSTVETGHGPISIVERSRWGRVLGIPQHVYAPELKRGRIGEPGRPTKVLELVMCARATSSTDFEPIGEQNATLAKRLGARSPIQLADLALRATQQGVAILIRYDLPPME